jgi:hypothetical protein
MHRSIKRLATLTILIASSTIQMSRADDCREVLRFYGFLSIAAIKCNFQFFNDGNANNCSQGMSESQKKSEITRGASSFFQKERDQGHAASCSQVLQDYPEYLR